MIKRKFLKIIIFPRLTETRQECCHTQSSVLQQRFRAHPQQPRIESRKVPFQYFQSGGVCFRGARGKALRPAAARPPGEGERLRCWTRPMPAIWRLGDGRYLVFKLTPVRCQIVRAHGQCYFTSANRGSIPIMNRLSEASASILTIPSQICSIHFIPLNSSVLRVSCVSQDRAKVDTAWT